MKANLFKLAGVLLGLALFPAARGDNTTDIGPINVTGPHFGMNPVPVALTGFSGTGLEVLKFDLYVQGFSFVAPSEAKYIISGSDSGTVSGTVTDTVTHRVLLSQGFNGGNPRHQAHAFADAAVQAMTGKPGIAQIRGGIAKIAFKAQESDGSGEIYIADFDGYNPVPITADHAIVAKPTWQAGHMGIYYTSYKAGNPDIYLRNLASVDCYRVAGLPCLNTSAASSPGGDLLAYVCGRTGRPNIWISSATGAGPRHLTTGSEDSSPCWSPDGQYLCYATKQREHRCLAKISVSGGAPEYLLTTGTPSPSEPDWSPDGKWIAYTSQSGGGFQICVIAVDGSVRPQILVDGQNPSWAPNSRTLIFNRGPEGRQALSVLDVFTKQYKDCHRASGSCSQPAWAK